jgi:protein-S-isoprenylcysteine O-methyltransferase Ste14
MKKNQVETLYYLEKSLMGTLIPLILFFVIAGSIRIIEAWLFFIIWFINIFLNSFLLTKYNPELIRFKEGKKQNTKWFDKILLPLYYFTGVHVALTITALNMRIGWFELLEFEFFIIGVLLIIISYIIMNYAIISNPFFETTVRIQNDRNQRVISKGLYKKVRHPGYTADFLWYLSLPLFLRSIITFIPIIIALSFLLTRTYLEDKTLKKELDGYKEYSKKVKYRLIPYIW